MARALFDDERLLAIVKISARGPVVADRTWLAGQLNASHGPDARFAILAGRPPSGEATGRIVCSCMGIGMNAIHVAIAAGAANEQDIGKATSAGTNCGSCKPELRTILESMRADVMRAGRVAAE